MRHGGGGLFGIFTGLFHAFAMFFILASAFLIGCWLDFVKHPMSWVQDYWFPALLIVVGLVGMVRDRR
jgi:uncharacterized membrane protein